jgi:phage shock protein E
MKTKALLSIVLSLVSAAALPAGEPRIENPRIDYPGFQRLVIESGPIREAARLTEEAFLEMMKQPGVVVLDARTGERYRRLHIAGAVNLPFTEFTAEALAGVIPALDTPVLIYCNNNFADRLDAFPTKAIVVSLNVSTYTSLRAYGYTRIYELGPLLRVAESRLPFAGTATEPSSSFPLADSTAKKTHP